MKLTDQRQISSVNQLYIEIMHILTATNIQENMHNSQVYRTMILITADASGIRFWERHVHSLFMRYHSHTLQTKIFLTGLVASYIKCHWNYIMHWQFSRLSRNKVDRRADIKATVRIIAYRQLIHTAFYFWQLSLAYSPYYIHAEETGICWQSYLNPCIWCYLPWTYLILLQSDLRLEKLATWDQIFWLNFDTKTL